MRLLVHCRIGSSENNKCDDKSGQKVHCRIGSSEIHSTPLRASKKVHCRTGSSEMSQTPRMLWHSVHCRTGSSENHPIQSHKHITLLPTSPPARRDELSVPLIFHHSGLPGDSLGIKRRRLTRYQSRDRQVDEGDEPREMAGHRNQ